MNANEITWDEFEDVCRAMESAGEQFLNEIKDNPSYLIQINGVNFSVARPNVSENSAKH